MRRPALALLLFAATGAAQAQPPPVEVQVIPAPERPARPPAPLPDFRTLSEPELRVLIIGRRIEPGPRAEALQALRARFPSEATRAFALNAEAQTYLDAWQTGRALALYREVRTAFGDRSDPGVEAEVATAMQGEVQAIEMAEALADTGPVRPIEPSDIDLRSPSNLIRREIVTRYAGRTEPAILRIVAQERFNLLQQEVLASGRFSDPARYMALVREYEGVDDPELQRILAGILSDLAGSMGTDREALAYWDDFLRRFGRSTDPELRSLIYEAYDNKRYVLEENGDREAAARVQAEQWEWFERAYPAAE
jgi:hypothetical protein